MEVDIVVLILLDGLGYFLSVSFGKVHNELQVQIMFLSTPCRPRLRQVPGNLRL